MGFYDIIPLVANELTNVFNIIDVDRGLGE